MLQSFCEKCNANTETDFWSKDLSDLLMSQNVKKTQFVLANSSFEGTEMQGYCVNLVTNTIY